MSRKSQGPYVGLAVLCFVGPFLPVLVPMAILGPSAWIAMPQYHRVMMLMPILTIAGLFVGTALLMPLLARQEQARAELLRSGRPAAGIVLKIAETGRRINKRPLARLTVRVQAPDDAYEVEVLHLVSVLEVPQYQPGRRLRLRIDPTDRASVAVEGPAEAEDALRDC